MSAQTNALSETKTFSMPRTFMHVDGLALLAGSLVFYANLNFNWVTFALLLFTPDLPLILYGVNKQMASIAYNLVHSLVFPILLLVTSHFADNIVGIQLSLIWLAHIGMDRVFGYGFKYLGRMKETHFSRV